MDDRRSHHTENTPVLTKPVCPLCSCACDVMCVRAGFELLYQPEVVRLYLSLLTESQNYNTLEAAAGALQNLSAGQWTVSSLPFRYSVVMLSLCC